MKFAIRCMFLVAGTLTFVAASTMDSRFVGTWSYTITDTPEGDFKGEMVIEKSGDTYSGYLQNDQGQLPFSKVKVVDGKLIFNFNYEGYPIVGTVTESDGGLKGNVAVEGEQFPLVATKK